MEKKWRKNKMNYYEILRVPSTASISEIKNAYKRLVKKYHPDIYEGNKLFAESKIKEINEAYEILSEKTKKEIYDSELNYKKYEPTKESYVKTCTKEDIYRYQKNYYQNFRHRVTKKDATSGKSSNNINKKIIDLNAIGKKYFFKFDSLFKTEEKEDMMIIILLCCILFCSIGILGFIMK